MGAGRGRDRRPADHLVRPGGRRQGGFARGLRRQGRTGLQGDPRGPRRGPPAAHRQPHLHGPHGGRRPALARGDASPTRSPGRCCARSACRYDVRRAQPHWAYDRVEFEVPTQKDGDNYARYLVRMAEMEQSMRIAEQALAQMPGGPINVDFEGRPLDPAAYVDQGKQGKTEGLLLVPIRLSPNLQGQNRAALHAVNAPDKRVVLPPKETAYGSIEGLMNHFMLIMEGYGIRPPPGEAYFAVRGRQRRARLLRRLRRRRPPVPRALPAAVPAARGRAAPHDRGRDDRRPHPHLRLREHDRRRARPMTAEPRRLEQATCGPNRPRGPRSRADFRRSSSPRCVGCRASIPTSGARCCPCCTWRRRPSAGSRCESRNTWRASSSSRRPTCTRS